MAFSLVIALLISLVLSLFTMPLYISKLKKISFNQTVSEYSLQQFKDKASTPTMGGVVFVLIPIVITLMYELIVEHGVNYDVLLVLIAFAGYGLIGFIDDYLIVVRHDNTGLTPLKKYLLQAVLAGLCYFIYSNHATLSVSIPLVHTSISLGVLYILLIFFMFTGASNAVNLTDGMDGLAAGCSVCSFIPFLIFACVDHNVGLGVFIASLIGALIGYLKYNVKPAKVFMGDVGALALGGALAAVAIVLKRELLLVIIGGVFVWETMTVIIQITSIKLFKKRIFRYTPIHYSYVMAGLSEGRVVRSFWTIAAVCSVIGLILGLL